MTIDLHLHTTASDGQYAPAALVDKAHAADIRCLAVTDHDSIGGVEEGRQRAVELGIDFIPGIEISVNGSKEMHILGYYIDVSSESVMQMNRRFIQLRRERAEKIIAYLQSEGLDITLRDVKTFAQTEFIGRPHFARTLLAKGYADNIREAFDKYLATPAFDKIERPKPSPEEGIRMIHDAGGVAVLAHPVSLGISGKELERLVESLIASGLDGIETYYGKHSPEQRKEYHAIAQKYLLIETAGSDFHGETVKPDIYLGMGAKDLTTGEAEYLVGTLREKVRQKEIQK